MNDVGVVGSGPAGIAASIYLKRAGIDVTLFEKNEIGGLLQNAHFVENYPGFPNGIDGKQLCKLMKDHLESWDINPIMEEVKQITIKDDKFILDTKNSKTTFKTVIIATGTKPRELGIPGEKESVGSLVFYEIKDLLPKIKHGNVCTVIGGGDAAFDYSLNLADKEVAVELYFRLERPECLSLLEERVKKCNSIRLHTSSTLICIKRTKGKPEIKFKSNSGVSITKESDYVLIACGREPSKELLPKDFEKNNIPGLYIAGDVHTGKFRQVGIAVGEGIHVAMSAEMYLRGIKKC